MELTKQHILWIEKGFIEIDEEKDRVVYKNLRSWEKSKRNLWKCKKGDLRDDFRLVINNIWKYTDYKSIIKNISL